MNKSYLLLFIFLLSCGKSIKDDVNESLRTDDIVDGTYSAILAPVNRRISSKVLGEAKIIKYGDDFQVSSKIKDAPANKFVQYLHTGSNCPDLDDDQNGDGYIDRYEFIRKAGPAILPLDGDLSSQFLGSSFTLRGNFYYHRSTSYYLMLFDLHLPDELLNDHIVKLKEDHLHIQRKVVAIFVTRFTELPVESSREVPVACGIMELQNINNPTNDDDWRNSENSEDEVDRQERPRPRPRPRPPNPDDDDQYDRPTAPSSWWDRLRLRWRWWRNRQLN